MSCSVVVALETEMRIRRWWCQVVAPTQHVPSPLDLGDDLVGGGEVAEPDQHLVEHHVVGDRGATLGQPGGHPGREHARALDEVLDAGAAELAQGRPDREAAGAARGVGDQVAEGEVVAARAGEVRRGVRHRLPVDDRVGDDRQPAVVRHVEPLVGVGGPGVGLLDAGDQVRTAGGRRGPEPEGAVHVHPGPGLLGERDGLREQVAGAGVHVAGLEADDRRPVRLLPEHLLQVGQVDRAVVVGQHRHQRRRAEAEQPQRAVDGGVPLGAGDDPDPRRPDQPVRLDVVARLLQHPVPAAGDAHGVGRLGAGDEPHRGATRKPEQVLHPAARGPFGRLGSRRQHGVEGVLVPPDGEQVRRRGGGRGAADHEAEVARADRADQVSLRGREQLVDHLVRRRRVLGERQVERGPRVLAGRRTGDGPVAGRGPVLGGDTGDPDEQVLAHSATRWVVVNSAE